MTPDHIALNAQQRPHAIAVVDHGQPISCARLHRELVCLCAALHGLGVRKGHRVALVCEHNYLHWLIRLACERLGAVSDAVLAPDQEPWDSLHERADMLLSTLARPEPLRCTHHTITQPWLDQLFAATALPAQAWPPAHRDDPVLVARTSGTTGHSRRMLLRRQDLDERIDAWARLFDLNLQSRCLLTQQPSAATAMAQAGACLQRGATVVFAAPAQTIQTLEHGGITHLACLPGALGHWLSQLSDRFVRPPALHMVSLGAPTSNALRALALARMASRFDDLYACNEAGHIATGQSDGGDGVGTVRPGVVVEITGTDGDPVPFGQIGQIRLRSPSLVGGYLDDPAATRLGFLGGWFYPGDIGLMPGPGRLAVLGRTHELLNLGGVKVSPHEIEAQLVGPKAPGHELAVCSLPNALGIDEVWVAVCGSAADNRADVINALTVLCQQYWWVKFRVIRLPQVHPPAPAKLSRAALRLAVQRQLQALAP